jgi:hypothetical protein
MMVVVVALPVVAAFRRSVVMVVAIFPPDLSSEN